MRNADPPDAGQSMIVMPLSGPGGRSTAREAASLPFATLATTAELHAVQSSSGGEGLRPRPHIPPRASWVNSCLLVSSAPSAASPRAPAASPSNRFCVLLCPVLAMSLCREGHRRRRRSGGPFITETTKTFHPSGCCCRQKNKFGARARKAASKERKKTDIPNEGWEEDRVPTCTSRILVLA